MTVSPQNLQAKFVRAFYVNPAPGNGTNGCMAWIMRLAYEFWGFCINGDNNLVAPGLGSMANSQLTGSYISMPVGWESGSNVLLASGSDGTTQAGAPYFTVTGSSPFAPNMVGKWLTMWQSGSTSTDDSIYLIKRWISSSSIQVDPTYGGTSIGPSGSVPQLTTRSNINYRVIDYFTAGSLAGYATGQYFVMQFSSAADMNPGQARSQAKLQAGGSFFTQFSITLSPSGSWDGTHFVGFKEFNQQILPEGNLGGPGAGGWGTPDWFHNSGGGTGFVTLIGNKEFIICQAGGSFMPNGGSSFLVEIPQRLYPQANDPNLICAQNFGNDGVGISSQVGYAFAHRFFPSPYDTSVKRWAMMSRCFSGAYWNGNYWGNCIQNANLNRWNMMLNANISKVVMSDAILCLPFVNGQGESAGQFSLARARSISTRYTAGAFPYYTRMGDNNDRWIHAGGGVLWPWDHAIVSSRQLFAGF